MSLISENFGACSGIGAFLFDGTWYDTFASAPISCASGVSAQSYHFFAFSMFFAPLMMLMLPIS